MRVLFIGTMLWSLGDRKGTPAMYWCPKAFEENGHEVIGIFPTNDKTLPKKLEYDGMEFHMVYIPGIPYVGKFSHMASVYGTPFRYMLLRKVWSGLFFMLFLVRSFWLGLRICMKRRVDLVYAVTHGGAGAASLLGRMLRKPVVLRFFGTSLDLKKPNGWWWLNRPADCLAFKWPMDALVMANDGSYGVEVARRLGVSAQKLFFWIDGVEKEHLVGDHDTGRLRRELGLKEQEQVVVMLARLAEEKRVDRGIRAFERIAGEMKDVQLVIVGDGEMREALEAQAKATGYGDRIRFVGMKPRSELAGYYHLADVFLYTSRRTSLSNPVLEALVCGCAMVVEDAGAVRDICRSGENAILVKQGDAEGMAVAVMELLRDEKKRQRFSEKARETGAKEVLSWHERGAREVGMATELARRFHLHVFPHSPKESLLFGVNWPEVYR